MSLAEAQARYLAALGAKAFEGEQMRLIGGAEIIGADGFTELQQSLAELPPEQLAALIQAMAMNPALLAEPTLAELASILGRRAL